MDIWNFLKGLVKKSEESSPSQPFIREAIERSEDDIHAYTLWINTFGKRQLLDWINKQYATFLMEPHQLDEAIDILNLPSSKGFVLYFDEVQHNVNDFKHLFDYLKDRTLEIGYKLYMSDRRIYTRSNYVETVERHYLKPPFFIQNEDSEAPVFHQRYGNITIELLFRNDEIRNLKYSATNYRDRNFTKAENFQDLMRKLLQ